MEYKLLDLRVHELKDDNSLVHYAHWEKVIVWSDTKKKVYAQHALLLKAGHSTVSVYPEPA